MQQQIPNDILSTKIEYARNRLRLFRRGLPNIFRGAQPDEVICNPSSSLHATSNLSWTTPPAMPAPSTFNPSPTEASSPVVSPIMDGAGDRKIRGAPKSPQATPHVAAIFVHAGAGYHSTTNEHVHLAACSDAARMAMRVLQAGGTAVDAVEAAIKVLEDKEITNAGYGSNLSIEGVVEADATIVDHLGRSGACGAAAQIKNPIHLARAILEASNKPLSLRRVPPNLLVAQGATDFAYENGIPIVHLDALVSKNARDRYIRWREDLRRAEGRMTPGSSGSSAVEELDTESEARQQAKQRRDHTNAILTGTWNEGQPDSPLPSPGQFGGCLQATCSSYRRSPSPSANQADRGHVSTRSRSPSPSPSKRPRYAPQISDSSIRTHSLLGPNSGGNEFKKSHPNISTTIGETTTERIRPGSSDGHVSPTHERQSEHGHLAFVQEGTAESPSKDYNSHQEEDEDMSRDEDLITDTVGAIAIDMFGNIAAGSSSGGIGMKHRGRVGPAALVGIGTAVVPADLSDPDHIAVAAVTSGTGEHMATTMASQKCADRLYHNTRRGVGGADIIATEEQAIESFVQADFMAHPGVSASTSMGAIGVMAVKQTDYGYFLHFAHNTDSFALSSMHSNERDPKCVMSRLGDNRTVVQGGRKIRVD